LYTGCFILIDVFDYLENKTFKKKMFYMKVVVLNDAAIY